MSVVKNDRMSIANLLITITKLVFVLLCVIFLLLTWLSIHDRRIDYDISSSGLVIPTFSEHTIAFKPSYDKTRTLPFAASAIVDIDSDGIEEVFFGGGIDQQDAIYQFRNGVFVDITASTNFQKSTPDKTFSAISLDFDEDGDNDLIVTRQSGVWYYTNQNATFSGTMLDLALDEETVPLSVGVADLNRDGHFDLFVAGYIARKYVQGETLFNADYGGVSELFINNGNNTFYKHTNEAGLSYKHNTFLGLFIDANNDQNEDLLVAHDTGTIRTWENQGDATFKNRNNPSSNSFAYPMGIAVTDLHNDGLPDFWFSNVGSTTPDFMVRGDLKEDQVLNKKWFMFKNKGNFVFSDIAAEVALADYEFSWGGVFEDFNLDGRDDLVVSENYVGWPLHTLPFWRLDGRFLLQTDSGKFAEVSKAVGVKNRSFGITPLTADFNQDGYPDLIHVNLLGTQKAFISNGGSQHYLKVRLPNTVASVSAKVTVTLKNGQKLNQFFIVGEGLVSDQSHTLIFGMNQQTATSVSVSYLNGSTDSRAGNFKNELISFTNVPTGDAQ